MAKSGSLQLQEAKKIIEDNKEKFSTKLKGLGLGHWKVAVLYKELEMFDGELNQYDVTASQKAAVFDQFERNHVFTWLLDGLGQIAQNDDFVSNILSKKSSI
jgi:hypothetical protein